MVESILKGLKGTPELQGPLQASIWDQGDAVGAWIGDKVIAVVFPTPETLPQVLVPAPCFALLFYALLLYALLFYNVVLVLLLLLCCAA